MRSLEVIFIYCSFLFKGLRLMPILKVAEALSVMRGITANTLIK